MAQSKVKDFFSTRKKLSDTHAAKRRKVDLEVDNLQSSTLLSLKNDSSPVSSSVQTSRSRSSPSVTRSKSDTVTSSKSKSSPSLPQNKSLRLNGRKSPRYSQSRSLSRSLSKQKSLSSSSNSQSKITDLLNKRRNESEPNNDDTDEKPEDLDLDPHLDQDKDITGSDLDSVESIRSRSGTSEHYNKRSEKGEEILDSLLVTEEITSTEDDHRSARNSLSTPRKRNIELEDYAEPPKTRKCKVPHRRGTTDSKPRSSPSKSVKKRLELDPSDSEKFVSSVNEVTPVSSSNFLTNKDVSVSVSGSQEADQEQDDEPCEGKSFLLRLVSTVESPDLPISPLAMTPERQEEGSTPERNEESPTPEQSQQTAPPPSLKLQNLTEKLKALSKMNGKAIKNRLKQNGKLEDVKQKLGDLDKALAKSEEVKAAQAQVRGEIVLEVEASTDKKAPRLPAYQRFEHLIKEGKPTLSLPFSYKSLESSYQAMDSVVSMLHNRSELCTFSKLKAAVQNFTKKNFEEKAVGQIKTVAPDAYILRQEKNVCTQTNKKGYTLTVEADLSKEVSRTPDDQICTTPEGKPMFTPAALIHRKQKFHTSLVSLVMKHHKTFLASLNPPLSIPDEKITRWHPGFRLDQVPDIEPSALPQPPDVRVYHSAKDVLEAQRGRLNPRVEEALAKVVSENKEAKAAASPAKPVTSSSSSSSSSSSASAPSSPSAKGIPPALLAKIRAKEALKMEAALTRDPEEDHKTKMMSHLPEMIRILRSYFITEKKPALPLEAIYKKLEDSYKSGISRKDVEQHVKLLASLAPELVTVVEIKRGSFLKFDRNVDSQAISTKLMNMVKARK